MCEGIRSRCFKWRIYSECWLGKVSKFGKSQPGFASTRKDGRDSLKNLFICLVAVSLILFTLSCREKETGPINSAKAVTVTITKPIVILGDVVCAPFKGIANVFSNLTASQETLQELRAENDKLQARNAELEESQLTAKRLEGLLEVKTTYDLQSTAARIISGAGDTWSETVMIDKGQSDGLSVGMPVLDTTGVIGQICECSKTTSRVRLITDENSKVSAMIQDSRAQGLLCGNTNGILNMKFVDSESELKQGDLVVTSGLGGVYPKGIPLGKVSSVEQVEGMPYYNIVVQPFNSLKSAEEVLIITSLSESQEIPSEEAKKTDAEAKAEDAAIQDKDQAQKTEDKTQ